MTEIAYIQAFITFLDGFIEIGAYLIFAGLAIAGA
mgnify:FL=1